MHEKNIAIYRFLCSLPVLYGWLMCSRLDWFVKIALERTCCIFKWSPFEATLYNTQVGAVHSEYVLMKCILSFCWWMTQSRPFLFILIIVKLPFFASIFQSWFCFTEMTAVGEHLISTTLNWAIKGSGYCFCSLNGKHSFKADLIFCNSHTLSSSAFPYKMDYYYIHVLQTFIHL